MSKTAAIFPGQGSQTVGMGRDVATGSKAARIVFERAADVLGFDLAGVCFEGPAEALEQTDLQQPAIFVTSAALWAALLESGASPSHFACAAGLSLGEYTALYVAGAVSFEEGLRLVRRRGQLMQKAALEVPSGMVSLIGADEATAHALCDRARNSDVLTPANFNCPGQVVVSGGREACARAMAVAPEFGCRAVALQVAGAFHSPIMEPAAGPLRAELESTTIQEPGMPVVANVSAEYHGSVADIRTSLTAQLTRPVLWQRCIERMIHDGVDEFVEIGPGRVLTGLMRKINRNVKTRNISTLDSVSTAVAA